MKIFIAGPEGAGKTVFATMLYRELSEHRIDGLLTKAGRCRKSHHYFTSQLGYLNKGEWPSQTKGKPEEYIIGWEYENSHAEVHLIDPPGHEIRRELCDESSQLQIKQRICESDLIILLVDLSGHQLGTDEQKEENAWIIAHILDIVSERQHLILAVSKADLISATLPERRWGEPDAIVKVIKLMMPECKLDGYRTRIFSEKTHVMAFAAVTSLDEKVVGDELRRLPKAPLESSGLDRLLVKVLEIWKLKNANETFERLVKRGGQKIECCWQLFVRYRRGAIGFVVAIGLYFLFWLLKIWFI